MQEWFLHKRHAKRLKRSKSSSLCSTANFTFFLCAKNQTFSNSARTGKIAFLTDEVVSPEVNLGKTFSNPGFFLNKIAKTQAQKNSRIPKLKLKFAPKLKVPELLLSKRSYENSRICSKTQGLFSKNLKKTQATGTLEHSRVPK